eukprot:jgi/Mesvir1/14214/Mv09664-RA.1
MGGYDAKWLVLLCTAILVVRILHLEREEPNLCGAGLFMSWMLVVRIKGFVHRLISVPGQQGWRFPCVVRLRLRSGALCGDVSACTVNFLHELLWVAALRGWRFAGVACLRLALWMLWWTLNEPLQVVRLIIYYPELVVERLVGLFLHVVCAVLRLVRRISRVVCEMAGAMAATREFRNIMVALSMAAIVIVDEIATAGHDGIVLALCKPDLHLELGALVGTVGWYILLGFWHRAPNCPWQKCSTQVWTSERSTTVLRCYRLSRHPGIVRRLAARHRPMRRRRCARRLAWAPVPLFGVRPRRGPCCRVRCIIRRRLPRPQRSAWRPTRYARAAPQRGPGPARQSRHRRRRMRASADAMCWCPRRAGGGGEPVYDGDCEIPLPGEEDLCEEGGDSDVGERIDVTGDWDESYCVCSCVSVLKTLNWCALARRCVFTTPPTQEEEDKGPKSGPYENRERRAADSQGDPGIRGGAQSEQLPEKWQTRQIECPPFLNGPEMAVMSRSGSARLRTASELEMECRCRFRYYAIVLLCLTYWVPSEISLLFVEGVGCGRRVSVVVTQYWNERWNHLLRRDVRWRCRWMMLVCKRSVMQARIMRVSLLLTSWMHSKGGSVTVVTSDGERIDPVEAGNAGLSPPGSDGKGAVDNATAVANETHRQKKKRENDEMKKFGMTLAEVRRLSRCLDTGDYAGFGMRPFKLRPLTDDPSAAHPYSLDEHRERSKCPKCHAPMFKEEEPKRSRCCSKGKAKVLEPNLNLIIEKRRRREGLLAEANVDECELARNELTHQEEMLWQIHCNPTNVALWIRYGRMINQFFAVARVVASGRIGDSVKNKGACVLELHGQTVERIKPIIRDGVHVNNDFFFLLDKPGKDEAQEDVLKRCEVKERDPNLRKLLDLLEEYLLTYNPLLQQFARQATEELEQRQASVEVAGQFSPEVHAPEIFLLPRWVGHGYGPHPWLRLSLATVHCCMH